MSESAKDADKVEHNLLQWAQLAVLGLILSEAAQWFYLDLGGAALAVLSLFALLKRFRLRETSEVLG